MIYKSYSKIHKRLRFIYIRSIAMSSLFITIYSFFSVVSLILAFYIGCGSFATTQS
jgi:hypothetical protein